MIQIHDLSFSYDKNKQILNQISVNIKKGVVLSVIGLNGAGKSTLFGCLTKTLPVLSESIIVAGQDINAYSFKEYAKLVSFVPQISTIRSYECIVRNYLAEGRTPYLPPCAVPDIAEFQCVTEVAASLGIEHLLGQDFAHLSGGEKQLVSIARAIIQDTPIIILDEPLSALDLSHQAVILKRIKLLNAAGKTVIFSTHNPNHALLLDSEILMLKDGSVMEFGKANECLTLENINRIYGSNLDLLERNALKYIVLKI